MELVADAVVGDAAAVVDEMAGIGQTDKGAVGEDEVADADELVGAVGRARAVVGDDDRDIERKVWLTKSVSSLT